MLEVFSLFHQPIVLKFKMGLGMGSNNYVELMALKDMMKCALERDLSHIQIFGDSSMVING